MKRSKIISALDTEITRLHQARVLLLAEAPDVLPKLGRRGPGRPKGSGPVAKKASKAPASKRTMSAEGKARIAAAQKARWARCTKPLLSHRKAKRRGRPL